jgi:hypothetical protein
MSMRSCFLQKRMDYIKKLTTEKLSVFDDINFSVSLASGRRNMNSHEPSVAGVCFGVEGNFLSDCEGISLHCRKKQFISPAVARNKAKTLLFIEPCYRTRIH